MRKFKVYASKENPKYEVYYDEVVGYNGKSYQGKRVVVETFDNEADAEEYIESHVGIQDVPDDYDGPYPYEQDGNGKYLEVELNYDEV